MQSLLGGADCSTSSNPLKQVLQREGVDNSIFRDRLGPATGPSSQLPFRPQNGNPQIAGPQQPLHANPTPHPFNLSHLSAALGSSSSQRSSPLPAHFETQWTAPPPPNKQIIQRPPPQIQQHQPNQSNWNGEYANWKPAVPTASSSAWAGDFQDVSGKGKGRAVPPPMTNGMGSGMQYDYAPPPRPGFMPFQSTLQPMYAPGMQQQYHTQQIPDAKQAEKEHAEMEAAFEAALKDVQDHQKEQKVAETQIEEVVPQEEEEIREAKGDFEKVWESLRPEAERLNQLAEWEKDFSQFTNDEDDLFDVLNDSLNRDDVGQATLDEQLRVNGMPDLDDAIENFDHPEQPENGLPRPREYEYASPNAFLNHRAIEAWYRAKDLLATGGSLSEATLLLESFIQQASTNDYIAVQASDIEAWGILGRTHAMNEKEEKALEAFEQGRKLLGRGEGDGDGGRAKAAGEMLTNLAISYVNESLDLAALTTLHQFLTVLYPQHAGLAPSRSLSATSPSPWALHEQMKDNFLALAREQYASNNNDGKGVDADVQVGLGTLYYMMGEYGEARDCWVAALGERPNDYLLWNRLGATLANSGNPEEAVDAYRRALELRPTYTRAIFNLGVACLNIGVHREAAEHFLAALSLHPKSDGDAMYESGSLWKTLRRALISLDMGQLAAKAVPGTDLQVFRSAGFEF